MRFFVALELPEDWRTAAVEVRAALEARLGEESARALRGVDPKLLRLTLRFLGEFPDAAVPRLQAELDRALDSVDLNLAIGGVGGFGGRNRIQVVWLGVAGDLAGLRTLADRVDHACIEAGALRKTRDGRSRPLSRR